MDSKARVLIIIFLWLFHFFLLLHNNIKKKNKALSDLSASRDLLVVQKFADNENTLSLSVEVGFTVHSAL
jgi:hypothetical protein